MNLQISRWIHDEFQTQTIYVFRSISINEFKDWRAHDHARRNQDDLPAHNMCHVRVHAFSLAQQIQTHVELRLNLEHRM